MQVYLSPAVQRCFPQSGSLTAEAHESQQFEVSSPEVGRLVEDDGGFGGTHCFLSRRWCTAARARPHETRRSYRCTISQQRRLPKQQTPILILQLTRMGLLARWGCPATSRLDPRAKRCLAALGGRSPGAIPGKLSAHLPSNSTHVTFPFS